MKSLYIYLSGLFLFALLASPVFAQTSYQLYVSGVKVEKPTYSVGETISGEFTLFNVSDTGQSDIYYSFSSGEYSPSDLTILTTSGITEKFGPVYLKGKSKETIPFQYTLPQSLSGKGAIQVTATLKDGTLVAQGNVPFTISGEPKMDTTFVTAAALQVSTLDTEVPPSIGLVIYDGETAELVYALAPTQTVRTITPILKLYDRTDNAENLIDTITFDSIKTSIDEQSKHAIKLPTDLEPLVYYGVLSFEGDALDISPVGVRYIIAGPIATIRNITTETLEVKMDQSFEAILTYGGQPLDELRPELQTSATGVTAEIIAYNENGEEISRTTTPIDLNDESRSINIMFESATSKAESLSFSATLIDSDGEILDEYQTTLPSRDELKNQESLVTKKMSTPIQVALALIAFIFLATLLIVLKKKKSQFKIPTVIVVGGLLVASGIFFARGVGAWEVTYTNRSENLSADFMFGITSVISPLPPEVKMYEPGEKFNLIVNYRYGDCNNEPARYMIATPKAENPFITAPSSDRYNWWNANGITFGAGADYLGFSYQSFNPNIFIGGKYDADYTGYPGIQNIQNKAKEVRSIYLEYKNNDPANAGIGSEWGLAIFTSPSFKEVINSDPRIINLKGEIFSAINNELATLNSRNRIHFLLKSVVTYPWRGGGADPEWIPNLFAAFAYPNSIGCYGCWGEVGSFHDTATFKSTVTRTYNAPTTPGFHKIPFYLWQDANSGTREIAAEQTICVRGAGVCPNEVEDPVICPFLIGTFTKDAAGVISRNGVETRYVQDAEGNCNEPPLPPECDPAINTTSQITCELGVEYSKTCNQDGTFNTVQTGYKCSEDFACYSDSTTYKTGTKDSTRYYVSPIATSYEWFSNGTKISGETGRSYSKTYDTTGTKTDVTVKITQNNATQTLSCRGQVNCDTSHRDREKTACIGGFQNQYYCSETGWKTTQIACDPTDPTDPTKPTDPTDPNGSGDIKVTTFKFEPSIVNPNATDPSKRLCGLTLEASNVSSCKLISSGINEAPALRDPLNGGLLYTKDRIVPTGRYTLRCTGIGEKPVTKTYGPQSCVGNPQFQED